MSWVGIILTSKFFQVVSIPGIGCQDHPCHLSNLAPEEFRLPTKMIRSTFASNSLDNTSHDTTPPPHTQTVLFREVFHNVQGAIHPLITETQTCEQVSDLIHSLEDLQYVVHFALYFCH